MDSKTAPTLILVIMIIFILLQAGGMVLAFTHEGLGFFWKAVVTIVPLVIIIALISVYIERLKELDDQEKDDLSKY